jgi:hypothetical protein
MARTVLRSLTGVGLALVFAHGLTVVLTDGWVYLPRFVWQVGLVLATMGCIALMAFILRWSTPWEYLWWDAVLGILCLLAALLSLAAATLVHGIVGHRLFFVIVLCLLIPASIALLFASRRTLGRKTRRAGVEGYRSRRMGIAEWWRRDGGDRLSKSPAGEQGGSDAHSQV